MKKLITLILINTACLLVFAQAPQGFEYQAVVRNASGNILVSQSVGLQITLKQGSVSGPSVYQETFTTTTNLYGLVNLQIGSGTTVDDFTTIDWATGPYFVEVALDVTGGTSYSVMGTSQLLSVPYALHAKTVEVDNVDDADNDPTNEIELPVTANVGDVLTWDGSYWVASPKNGGKTYLILSGDITDTEAAAKISEELGANTQFVYIENTTNLTTVNLSQVSELVALKIMDNTSLSMVDLSGLVTVFSDNMIINNTNLNSLSFTSLKNTNNLVFTDNPSISSLNLSNLEVVKYGLQFERCFGLTSIDLGNLKKTNQITIHSTLLSTLDFPSIESSGFNTHTNINISGNTALNNISFPSSAANTTSSINSINITGNTSLSTLNLPFHEISMTCYFQNNSLTSITHSNLFMSNGAEYYIAMNKLTSSSINSILNHFANVIPTQLFISYYLDNQNPLAPPTGQGIIDKNTLISNGNNVITD